LGLLGIFQSSPLKKLQAEMEENPSPEVAASLAQMHIELGQMNDALLVAEKGLQTYKNSPKLRELVRYIRRQRANEPIKRLRDEIKVKPSPAAFTQLGDIYRDLGEIEQSLDLLVECTEKFPEEVVAFRLIGMIRLENFLQEVIAYDGLHAYRALKRGKELAPDDSNVRILLAQLYFAVGANALSVQELREELKSNSNAMEIKDFLDDLGSPPPLDKDINIEGLVERCEETGALTNSLQGFPRMKPGLAKKTGSAPRINGVAAAGRAKELAGMPGVLNLAILDRDGKPVAAIRNEGGLEDEAFRSMAFEMAGAAGDACRRMDIGSFVRGTVAFPGGGVALLKRRGTTFALHFGDPLKADKALPALENLVLQILGGGAGA
jgi:tetratricopeptide (TPR) repeat protein